MKSMKHKMYIGGNSPYITNEDSSINALVAKIQDDHLKEKFFNVLLGSGFYDSYHFNEVRNTILMWFIRESSIEQLKHILNNMPTMGDSSVYAKMEDLIAVIDGPDLELSNETL